MRTLIVSRSLQDPLIGAIKQLLGTSPEFAEPAVATAESVERKRFETKTDLVIVLQVESGGNGQDVIRRLRETFKGPMIVVGEAVDPKVILRALQTGADLFVDVAELEVEFPAALRRLFPKPEAADNMGNLIGVLSASGGCGASTLAVNLAAVRAREHGKCVLVDLNLGHGDLAALLDLKPQFSVADVCLHEGRLDQAMLAKMLAAHSSGVHLLASPPEFADARVVTPSGVSRALALARKMVPETIVDLEDCFHAEQVEVLRQATGVLLVCRLEFTSLRNTRRLLDQFAKVGIERSRVKVVVNHHGQPGELPVEDAEDALTEKLVSFIPHDPRTINASTNSGVPAVLADPGSHVVKSIKKLANIDFEAKKQPSQLVRSIKHLFQGVFHAG